jgi:molybdopterin molybdotransferase
MISVHEAEETISRLGGSYPSVSLPLSEATGHILREPVVADRDQPPFDRVCMDGIGIRYADWEAGCRDFAVASMQFAGEPPHTLQLPQCCIEVMTGAVMPAGCDCIIPYELIEVEAGVASVSEDANPQAGQHVHVKGSDASAGDTLLKPGGRLRSPQMAVLASMGYASVQVDRRPRVAVIATGDELVAVDGPVAPHQIRMSNVVAVSSKLQRLGYVADAFHLPDDESKLRDELDAILETHDLLILSGGVSKGKRDYVPSVLADLGVAVAFHGVAQRPGKPFWFGRSDRALVFALPGNPVSALTCFHRYVLSHLPQAAGDVASNDAVAILSEPVRFTKPLTRFMPVQLSNNARGEQLAIPRPPHGSGDFGSLANTDGFVELAADQDEFPAGTLVRLFRW